jgi:hypothetical protein
MLSMRPAVAAFDAIAPVFDQRFGAWLAWLHSGAPFARHSCGNFRNAAISWNWEGAQAKTQPSLRAGYEVFLTDPSPTMVATGKGQIVPVWRTG